MKRSKVVGLVGISILGVSCLGTTLFSTQAQAAPRNRPDLNGILIRNPGTGAIYWIDQGKKRPIAGPPIYERLFVINDQNYLETDVVETGAPITNSNRLVRCGEENHPLYGSIYFLDQGTKRPIASPAAMQRNNFNPSGVSDTDCPTLEALPNGSSIN